MKINTLKTKLKEIYYPYLIISIGTFLLYNIFRWVLDIKLGILPLKEDVLNFWLPIAFSSAFIFIWLRKKIRIIAINGKRDNGRFIYQMLMAASIIIPLMISQQYIVKASYNLNEIATISEVKELGSEKYFKINSFKIDHNSSLPRITTKVSGKYNDNLNFHLHIACPFESTNSIWYGVKYFEQIDNSLSDKEKNSKYRNFLTKSENDFDNYNFQEVVYFEKLGYSNNKDGYLEAIKEHNPDINEKEQIILIPKTENFDERLGNTLTWSIATYIIGAIIILAMVLYPKIDEKELNNFRKNKPLKDDPLVDILGFLNPTGNNKATAILLLLNITVFIFMVFYGLDMISPSSNELLEIGGNRRTEVLNGEYWRLFTSIFIHGGFMHLFLNLIGLGLGASLLEYILGPVKLITIYIICGILASLTSIFWHENTVSVGASGAIFGLYGLILAFTVFNIYPKYLQRMNWGYLVIFAGAGLLFGLTNGIDNSAHIGGLISGIMIGGILILVNKEQLLKNAK